MVFDLEKSLKEDTLFTRSFKGKRHLLITNIDCHNNFNELNINKKTLEMIDDLHQKVSLTLLSIYLLIMLHYRKMKRRPTLSLFQP